jgi:hypothetical protein
MNKLANLEGFKRKFIVIKDKDYDMVTTPSEMNQVSIICHRIKKFREREGKEPNPTYLVINADEPYADEVIEIMKRHGHWG